VKQIFVYIIHSIRSFTWPTQYIRHIANVLRSFCETAHFAKWSAYC